MGGFASPGVHSESTTGSPDIDSANTIHSPKRDSAATIGSLAEILEVLTEILRLGFPWVLAEILQVIYTVSPGRDSRSSGKEFESRSSVSPGKDSVSTTTTNHCGWLQLCHFTFVNLQYVPV